MSPTNCYEILHVARHAGHDEIQTAFGRRLQQADAKGWRGALARRFGADRPTLEQSRDTLLDPVRRADHDAQLKYTLPLCPPA